MDLTGAGGGLMLALAAGLWLAYLVPNWLRRKEFAATERNAVRLQQTIRVLAETSEAPIAPARRLSPPAAPRVPVPSAATRAQVRMSSARRVRRSRAIASLVLLTGMVTTIAQVGVVVATGWSTGGVLVMGIGAVLGVSALAMLRRLAAVHPGAATSRQVQHRSTVLPDIELPSAPVVREWTPVPVPSPRLRPEVAPSTMADPRIAVAAAAEREQRAHRGADREVAPLAPAAQRSRFAAMGLVEEPRTSAFPDLDAVLARRRA
jgi:hypothetical protein